MFLIFTKSDCISSKKIIEYVKDRNQTYKEVNTSLECLNDDHIKLLSSIKGKSFLNFLRPKASYFSENSLDYNSLSENVLLNIIKFNLKDTGSFPIILFLSYSGKVKNCMMGLNEEILDSWIENESIENVFIDCNKPYGTEECCWLDKKEKILSEIKSKYSNNKNTNEDLLSIDNSNLFNLKKINDRLVGKESLLDQFEELKKDSQNLNKNDDVFKKYIDARNKIIDNDNQHKNHFDFFEIENKNKSFLEQLENEKNDFLSKQNNLDDEISFEDFNFDEKNNENPNYDNLNLEIDNDYENDNFENNANINDDNSFDNFKFEEENNSNVNEENLEIENDNLEHVVEDLEGNNNVQQESYEEDEFIEINYNEHENNVEVNNTLIENESNESIDSNDDFISTTQDEVLDDNKEIDYSLSNNETVVEESLVSDYLDDENSIEDNFNTNQDDNAINNEQYDNVINNQQDDNVINNELEKTSDSDDEFIQPTYIKNDGIKENNEIILDNQDLSNDLNENVNFEGNNSPNELSEEKKEDSNINIENNLNNNENDDFITVDLSEDPFLKNITMSDDEQNNNDFIEVQNDGEGLKIFEIDEQTQHIKKDNLQNNKNYLNTSNKVIDEYDEWINKYELTESEIAHQKAIENEK